MNNINIKVELETRRCTVNGEVGLFHCWEQYSNPVAASPLVGGEPAGVFSRVFGIVEFSDSVQRVDPIDIRFCDEQNQFLSDMARQYKERQFYIEDGITFNTKEDAKKVLDELKAIVVQYGNATVADLYDLAGRGVKYTDNKQLWTNLNDAFVVRINNGYSLRLPKPVTDNK